MKRDKEFKYWQVNNENLNKIKNEVYHSFGVAYNRILGK